MLLLYMLIASQAQVLLGHQFNMDNTNNGRDRYCLSYYSNGLDPSCRTPKSCTDIQYTKQVMSYCFRAVEENDSTVITVLQPSSYPPITFAELRQNNITSKMLLSWSASIDTAEQYEIFLNNRSNLLSKKDVVFYNCTFPWFGPFCRFIFDYATFISFDEVIEILFLNKDSSRVSLKLPCYIHLTCQTLLSCLDWREICDGKQDCLDGSDEKNCWQLEINQCADNEYRCSNGQCIPIEFFHDDKNKPDCLDRTDEEISINDHCYTNPDFECEEHTCQSGELQFPCGDGHCVNDVSMCHNGRHSFLLSDFCSNATLCYMKLYDHVNRNWCLLFCSKINCVKDNCPTIYEFRYLLPIFGHVRLMINKSEIDSHKIPVPYYVCYDTKLCAHFPPPTAHFNNLNCHHFNDLRLPNADSYLKLEILVNDIKDLFRGCLIITNETHYCNYSTMYQCENSSKCISKQRLLDGILDCPFNDDEKYNRSCSLNDIRQRFHCYDEDNEKCFTFQANNNGKKECKYGEDEYIRTEAFSKTHISFPTICDGVPHLLPLLIEGKNETDETGCEPWQCNNTYSRCDGVWLCKNGADEVNCPLSTCPEDHHACVFLNDTSKVSCLPIDRAGNDDDNCLGGTDEQTKYRVEYGHQHDFRFINTFHCWNNTKTISIEQLCDNRTDCPFNDDEAFCQTIEPLSWERCMLSAERLPDVENFFCQYERPLNRLHDLQLYFKLNNIVPYPLRLETGNTLIPSSTQTKTRFVGEELSIIQKYDIYLCNRGVPIRFQMNDNTSTLSCLCPPSYYGDKCQYQNQRVSLTVQVKAISEWRSIFIFLITLIDNERNIQSHNYLEFLSIRDCIFKFNTYLLYSTRPKNSSKTYSVQIDAFNGLTWTYRGSWIFPLQFPFLPVHRLAVLLRLPLSNEMPVREKYSLPCVHGQYFRYVNDKNSVFCQCESDWSGAQCDVKYICDCAPDSLCISNSICLCPPGRFGSRCHLFQSSCDSKSCINAGYCAPFDARYIYFIGIGSLCICPEGYVGDRCENRLGLSRIDISFHQRLTIPTFLLVHLIAIQDKTVQRLNRISIAKKLQFNQYSLTLYTAMPFNIAIAQVLSQYYLIILRKQTISLANISTQLIPSHRCQSINELFNENFTKQHLLKRIKYYHVPCQQQSKLICFYDDVHFCLCTFDRLANCFEFDHNMKYECEKHKYCGNGGQCFQDDLKCPTSSFCACHQCYFGSQCQFSTKVSALSLDIILGYHIRSNNTINQQANIVKVAIVLTTIIFAFGIINSFFSLQTFRQKETRDVGCGLYLFISSIISLATIVLLVLKFAFLVASQVGLIRNRLFLQIQCASMDFLLRSLLNIGDWLSACVAIERVVNVSHGVKFNKTKSKQVAKWMILIVVLCTSCSYIYDPIHRHLMDDKEEQRTWCLTEFPSSVQVFDSILNIFHFSVPFAINCISALAVIIIAARTRSNSQKKKTFKEHLLEQLHYHKHLLISSMFLIVLALPRLILSFLSGCMGSAQDSWFYLIGYYTAFMPSTMILVVFVLPSELYKKELMKSITRILRR